MTKICPVCSRQQCETTGIWIAVDDKDTDRPNYYMCSDCYLDGRKAYRDWNDYREMPKCSPQTPFGR